MAEEQQEMQEQVQMEDQVKYRMKLTPIPKSNNLPILKSIIQI